jgi:hypothetical protein
VCFNFFNFFFDDLFASGFLAAMHIGLKAIVAAQGPVVSSPFSPNGG